MEKGGNILAYQEDALKNLNDILFRIERHEKFL